MDRPRRLNQSRQNLTFFDLTLNLISIFFFDKIKLSGILAIIFEFYVEIGS